MLEFTVAEETLMRKAKSAASGAGLVLSDKDRYEMWSLFSMRAVPAGARGFLGATHHYKYQYEESEFAGKISGAFVTESGPWGTTTVPTYERANLIAQSQKIAYTTQNDIVVVGSIALAREVKAWAGCFRVVATVGAMDLMVDMKHNGTKEFYGNMHKCMPGSEEDRQGVAITDAASFLCGATAG